MREASLISPHIRPARVNPAGGKLDQRAFWASSDQSKETVSFSVLLRVARKALVAATILGVVSSDVLAVALAPVVGVDSAAVVWVAVASATTVVAVGASATGVAVETSVVEVASAAAVVAVGAGTRVVTLGVGVGVSPPQADRVRLKRKMPVTITFLFDFIPCLVLQDCDGLQVLMH